MHVLREGVCAHCPECAHAEHRHIRESISQFETHRLPLLLEVNLADDESRFRPGSFNGNQIPLEGGRIRFPRRINQ